MPEHNPMVFISSLGAKLATRSRHVCAFLGAGVGRACGLPDVEGLQQHVLDGLRKDRREALSRQLKNCNLEEALSRIRRISALISGEETVDGLTATKAEELDKAVCQIIVRSLSVNGTESAAAICLGAWAARANYHLPVELFTVNYDLLLENALESMRVPYFDGFVGTLQARFHTELVEGLPGSDDLVMPPYFVRLWKLHGSVNWAWDKNKQIVRLGQAVPDDQAAAIYPSDTKYEESRRVPFVVLQDRFRRALHQPETLMLITGYSFGDEHLNEQIFDAATRRERSEFIAFCYSNIPELLVERAAITPNFQVISGREAIIGGIRANWSEPENAPDDIWCNGQFALPDFNHLAKFLARSSGHISNRDGVLRDLLERVLSGDQIDTAGDDDD